MKDKKNILIAVLLLVIVGLAVGYAALSATLTINGTATIDTWDVEITGITTGTPVGTAQNKTDPTFTATTATFDALLQKKGDSISYTITIENKGTIDAELDSITWTPDSTTYGASPIIYAVTSQPAANSVLAAGASTTVVISATFDSTLTDEQIQALTAAQKTKTISAVLVYKQHTGA